MVDSGPVLITGAAGQLGRYLIAELANAGIPAIATASKPADGIDMVLDITDPGNVQAVLNEQRPSAVIHAAAWTDVDGCERDPEKADLVNHLGTQNIAQSAKAVGAWLVAVGTDFVFSGNGGAPYGERVGTDPISQYGLSKLRGEEAVLAESSDFCVARTAWVYGGAGKHFPRTVLTVVRDRGGMEVVDDEIGCPTFAGDLAKALVQSLQLRPSGILHLTNAGPVSRFAFARSIVETAGGNPELVQPTTTPEFLTKYPLPAKRPANSTLQNNRAAAIGITLPDWQDANQRYIPLLARELGFPASS